MNKLVLVVLLVALSTMAFAQQLAITGTSGNPTQLYVDSGAATTGASGCAMKPFRAIADALALCPPVLTQRGNLDLFYTIDASGNFIGVTIDRPIIIAGPCTLDMLTVNDFTIVQNSTINDLTVEASACNIIASVLTGDLVLTDVSNLTIKDSVVVAEINFDEAAEGGTTLTFMNSYVTSLVEVPVSGFTVTAVNTVFTDPDNTGTIELINSYQAEPEGESEGESEGEGGARRRGRRIRRRIQKANPEGE